jgi:hypothetical protein
MQTEFSKIVFLSYIVFHMVSLFSRLFWVSSLAYPNLLGTKGYVVVVVVVVVVLCFIWSPLCSNRGGGGEEIPFL